MSTRPLGIGGAAPPTRPASRDGQAGRPLVGGPAEAAQTAPNLSSRAMLSAPFRGVAPERRSTGRLTRKDSHDEVSR